MPVPVGFLFLAQIPLAKPAERRAFRGLTSAGGTEASGENPKIPGRELRSGADLDLRFAAPSVRPDHRYRDRRPQKENGRREDHEPEETRESCRERLGGKPNHFSSIAPSSFASSGGNASEIERRRGGPQQQARDLT